MTGRSRRGHRELWIGMVLAAFVCLSVGTALALGASGDRSADADVAELADVVEQEYHETELAVRVASSPVPALLLGGGLGLGAGLIGGSVLAYRRRRLR